MKSSILNLAAKLATVTVFVAALAFSTVAPAQTASGYHYKAEIPFQFMVENKVMPAGTYFVDLNGHFLRLSLAQTNRSIAAPIATVGVPKVRGEGALVFNVYNNQYFLSKLVPAGSEIGREVPQGSAEREIASLTGHTQVLLALLK